MKKKIITAAVAAMITLTTGVVMANPVEIDGSASFRYRADTDSGKADSNNNITKIILNANTEIDPNFSVYARLGVLGLANSAGPNAIGTDTNETGDFVGGIDQFGVNYKNAGFTYKIGRQSATIGATALLYNNNFKIGKHAFVDGISAKGVSGVTTLDIIAAQEDSVDSNDSKLYAVHASYVPAENWVVGATLGKYDDATDVRTTTNYAIDAAYTMGKATVFGEFAKSNYDNKNKSYDLGVSYKFDSKNSVYIINYDNEQFADMGGKTDFENGYKGFYYGYDHKFTDTTSVALYYRDMEALADSSEKNTSFRATVNYTF